MANMESERAFNQGLASLKAGDRATALAYIAQASQLDPSNQQAWLWLAGLSDQRAERVSYLTRVLQLNPQHPAAIKALSELGLQPEDVLLQAQAINAPISQAVQTPAQPPAQSFAEQLVENDPIGNILNVLRSQPLADQAASPTTHNTAHELPPTSRPKEAQTQSSLQSRISAFQAEVAPSQQVIQTAPAVSPDAIVPPRLRKHIVSELRKGTLKGDVVLEVAERLGVDWEKAEEMVNTIESTNYGKIKRPSIWNWIFGGIALFVALVVIGMGYLIAPQSRSVYGPSSTIMPFIRNIVILLSLISAVFDLDLLMINRVAMLGPRAARSLYAAIAITLIFFMIFPIFAFI